MDDFDPMLVKVALALVIIAGGLMAFSVALEAGLTRTLAVGGAFVAASAAVSFLLDSHEGRWW